MVKIYNCDEILAYCLALSKAGQILVKRYPQVRQSGQTFDQDFTNPIVKCYLKSPESL